MAKKKADKNPLGGRASDFAKNIWLAGLGAYGEAYDEMTTQQKSLKELPQLFKELVAKGSGFESSSDSRPKKATAKKAGESSGILSNESIEQRIRRMRDTLQLSWPQQSSDELQRLEGKIDTLSLEIIELKSLIKNNTTKTKVKPKTKKEKVKAETKRPKKSTIRKPTKKTAQRK